MDKTTQCNFPIVATNRYRHIWRHNTSVDLYDESNNSISNSNSWSQVKPFIQRPRSMNFSEAFNNSRIIYPDSSLAKTSIINLDVPIGAISRERTPPISSPSSVLSLGGMPTCKSPLTKINSQDEESVVTGCSKCYCRCCDIESGKNENAFTNSAKGLSWRKLHTSRAKLKATATTSELLSGFAMISMVELQINTPTNVPEWLFVMFAICTTVLVAVHIFALMISTYILPNIEAIAKLEMYELISESPHERMKNFIEIAWAFSTVLGLFLFLIELSILCWVKFWDYSFAAAVAATVIVIPALIIFVLFAAHFYHSLVVYKCKASDTDMAQLEDIKKHLDQVTITV